MKFLWHWFKIFVVGFFAFIFSSLAVGMAEYAFQLPHSLWYLVIPGATAALCVALLTYKGDKS